MKILRAKKFYERWFCEEDKTTMYIFTDDCNRSSGRSSIPIESWYSEEFGAGKKYPNVTSACIRGIDNAYPITTQHWYRYGEDYTTNRWNDEDFDEFKEVIDEDFTRIRLNAWKYKRIVFPYGGIFNSKIANISKERTPLLYEYLMEKCKTLYDL